MQDRTKQVLKKIIPRKIASGITGLFYGWHGNYSTWEEAKKRCSGYDSHEVFDAVSAAAGKVRDGQAVYERDSVLFNVPEYSFPLLSSLMWIAAQNRGSLNIIDFGGSLGSTYHQNRIFLDTLPDVNWCVVEQPDFVTLGMKDFSTGRLHFFHKIEDCLKLYPAKTILLSSVIHYLEDPYGLLESIFAEGFDYVIVDRTPFIKGKDRITIQKVHPAIYKADYPCWFLNKSKFLSFFDKQYEMIFEFDALDRANIPSEFRGFLFRRKS